MANTATTLAEAATQASPGQSFAQAVDRWIYVFMPTQSSWALS